MAPHACTTNSSSTDNDSSDNKHKDFSNERDSQSTSDNLSFNDEEQDILEPIAIIGYSFKLPQDALTPASFWKMLQEKRCAMTEWPEDRLNIAGFFHPDKRKMCTLHSRGGHFMTEDIAAFDAAFFSITAEEATAMDPQHRLLLETTYHALENSGNTIEKVAGSKTAVYTGSMADDYRFTTMKTADDIPKYSATGSGLSLLANRLSWFYNLRGPSINLDSACSSSLMALDFACQGLRNGDSTMALVAGSSLNYGLESWISLNNMGFLSPDSKCYSFDSRANGYARGEGIGVAVLKRVSDAIRDGDTIRAVIRSTQSNSDGRTPGITQPSRDAQALLIRETYSKAGLDLRRTRYFEAHGTGTPIGDPIEAEAIGSVFRVHRSPSEPLFIGALKANIGHLEGGAGIAAIIKTILVLEKGVIPPNANFKKVNGSIDVDFSNLKFPTEITPWPSSGLRRVSVNSFGFGGSNSHCIIEDAYHFLKARSLSGNHCSVAEPPSQEDLLLSKCRTKQSDTEVKGVDGNLKNNSRSTKLLVWSSADEGGVTRLSEAYISYFQDFAIDPSDELLYLSGLADTLARQRSLMAWRSFAVVDSLSDLRDLQSKLSQPKRSGKSANATFVFTGQGAQYYQMGIELCNFPVFEASLRRSEAAFHELGSTWSLLEELRRDADQSKIDNPAYSQPLCTALQIALVDLLRIFGILPTAVVGHSSGEIAAAYAVGGISLESACKVAFFRGKIARKLQLSSTNEPGAMMSVNIPAEKVYSYIQSLKSESKFENITIACLNSPQNVTLSGVESTLDALQRHLEVDGIFARKITTGVAYHSLSMKNVSQEYLEALGPLTPGVMPTRPVAMISSVTGERIADFQVLSTGKYWNDNMVHPVKFSQSVSKLLSPGKLATKNKLGARKSPQIIYDLIEIGPHSALQRPTHDIIKSLNLKYEVRYHSVLSRQKSSIRSIMGVMGDLHAIGYAVDLKEVNQIPKQEPRLRKVICDLPSYPFNHSKTYWHENWTRKSERFREHPRLELLGTPASDWNPLEARWEKVFDIVDTPWMEDHKVNNKVIYPAAGMVVMVIEAVKQISSKSRIIKGFRLRDTTVSSPIGINASGNKTVTQLFMRPLQNNFDKLCPSSEFRICVKDKDSWKEVGKGVIQVEFESTSTEVDRGIEEQANAQSFRATFEHASQTCTQFVAKEKLYQHMRNMGLEFGPTFQRLDNILYDEQATAIAEVKTFDWAEEENELAVQPHTIHPTTLDAALQCSLLALTKGATKDIPLVIPTRIKSAWISASGLGYPESSTLRVYSTARFTGAQKAETSSFTLDEKGNVKIVMSNFESTAVSSNDLSPESNGPRQLCYYMNWKPDVNLLQPQEILNLCKSPSVISQEKQTFFEDLDMVSHHFTMQLLEKLQESDFQKTKPHLRKYIESLRHHVQKYHSGGSPTSQFCCERCIYNTPLMETLITRVNEHPLGKAHVAVGRKLLDIIQGHVDPLELLFSDDNLAEGCYRDICDRGIFCQDITKYLNLLVHKNPRMKILEVGAGKGSFTNIMLPSLLPHDGVDQGTELFLSYDYTDISESFFEIARERITPKTCRFRFKMLDIENDPTAQGFELGSYDLVLAHSVIHATSNLAKSIKNCRSLLKPGGKLIMLELTQPDLMRSGFVFGLLQGWWLSTEDFREWGPCISEDRWDISLRENGFSGIDFSIQDYENSSCHEFSIFVSTATDEATPAPSPDQTSFTIVYDDSSALQRDLTHEISLQLKSLPRVEIEIITLSEVISSERHTPTFFIFLPELENPFLYDMSSSRFDFLKRIAANAQNLLWVTHGIESKDSFPRTRMIDGLARVLRGETNNRTLLTLDFQDEQIATKEWSKAIAKVLTIKEINTSENTEVEYIQRDGLLLTSRVTEAKHLDKRLHSDTHAQLKEITVKEAGAIVLNVEKPGLLDSLYFTADPDYEKPLPENEIEVKLEYLGLNFRDLLVALGRHNESSFGCESSGIVTRIGAKSKDFKKGDRVGLAKIGCMNTYVRCNSDHAFKIPHGMTIAGASGFISTSTTAYYSLINVANLQKGELILIHSASGATGQMAIQIAQHIGCEIFVTVGFDKKKELLMELYGIPEDHIFYSRNLSFAAGIMRMTNNRGVDVVLNSLSSDALAASWEVVAPFGRFIELGKVDIAANSKLPMASFAKNVLFAAVAIDHLMRERPEVYAKVVLSVLDLFKRKILRAIQPMHIFPISKLQEGLRLLESGKSSGKIVFCIGQQDLVPTLLHTKPQWNFDPLATYLIAGGLGGLGRSAALWMASRGAKNLILLSRSGATSSAAISLLRRLEEMDVRVAAPRCDVSSQEHLSRVISESSETFPPIKGCIQGTMVLRDALFEKMSFEDWTTTVSSKVDSSWNLHTLLPQNLDFFILLSSISGVVGNIGQSNYAAGNTFQDALCLHRLSRGKKAACLRLGLMADIGIISEKDDLFKSKDLIVDMVAVKEVEFLSLLDYYCNPALGILSPENSLPIIGLMTPAQLESQGMDVPVWLQRPTFRPLALIGLNRSSSTQVVSGSVDFASELRQVGSLSEAKDVVLKAMVARLSKALAIPEHDIDSSKPLHAYGVDSLLAVELRNWFGKVLGADVAVFDIMGAESIVAMSGDVARKSSLVNIEQENQD